MKTLTLKEAYASASKISFEILRQNKPDGKLVLVSRGMEIATIETGEAFEIDEKLNAALLCHAFNVLPEVVAALQWAESMLAGKLETDNAISRALKNSLTLKIP